MTAELATSDQQTWRVIAHASAFVQLVGIPSVVGPLVVWLIRRDDPVVEPHARAALNFQISLLIYFMVGVAVAFVAALTIVGLVITVLILVGLLILVVLEMVFALLATVEASKGQLYHYPLSLNLIKG
jgi:uncharacterized protein